MDELWQLLGRVTPSTQTTSLFQRSMQPVMQGQPQYLPDLEVTATAPAPAPTPTIGEALRRAQIVDREADQNLGLAQLREEALQKAMARLETLKGSVSDAALAPLLFALGGASAAGQFAESAGQLTGLETLEQGGRAVREGAGESLGIVGSSGAAQVPFVAGALAANFAPYSLVARFAPFAAVGGAAALGGRAIASSPVDLVQAAQQEGSTAQLLRQAAEAVGMERTANVLGQAEQSILGRFAVEALTNIVPDVVMEYALPSLRRGAQAALEANDDILASRRGAIDLGGGTPDVPPPEVPRVPEDVVPPAPPSPGDVPPGGPTPEVPRVPEDVVPPAPPSPGDVPPGGPMPPVYTPTMTVPEPMRARYENLIKRFDPSNPDSVEELRRIVSELENDPKFRAANKIQRWEDVEAAAERYDLPLDLNDISLEEAKSLGNVGLEAIGARTARNLNALAEISEKLKKQDTLNPLSDIDPATGQPYVALTDTEIAVLKEDEARLIEQLFSGAERLMTAGGERGRRMNFLKKMVKAIDDPTYWARHVLREVGPERVRDLGPDFQAEVARAIQAKDHQKLYDLVDKARRTPWNAVISRLVQSMLLSKPATFLVQVASLPRLALEGPSSPIAALINRSIAESITAGGKGPLLTGWNAQKGKALIEGAKKGSANAKKVLFGKALAKDVEAGYYRSTRSGIRLLDFFINSIFRGQSSPDQVARTIGHDLSIIGQAQSIARYENPTLTGAALEAKVQELVESPTLEMRARAVDDENRIVYGNETQLGRVARAIQRIGIRGPGNTLDIPIGVTQSPFVRVPFGLMELGYDLSPLGLTVSLLEAAVAGGRKLWAGGKVLAAGAKPKRFRSADFIEGVREAAAGGAPKVTGANATTVVMKDGTPAFKNKKLAGDVLRAMKAAGVDAKAAQHISRGIALGITGGGLYKLGAFLDEQGMITPTLDENERSARATLGMAKIPEGALIAGGRYWDIGYAGHAIWASILAGAAYNQERNKMRERGEEVPRPWIGLFSAPGVRAATKAAGVALKGVVQNPLFESQRRLQEALQDPEQDLPRYLQDIALNAVIPAAVSATARGLDPTIAQPTTFAERFQARIPGLSENVPNRLTPFGQPQERLFPGVLNQLVTPIRVMPVTYQRDRLMQEIIRTGARISMPAKRRNETDEQYRARVQADGPVIVQALVDLVSGNDLVRADEYIGASKNAQAEMIEEVIARTRTNQTRIRNAEAAEQGMGNFNSTNVGVQLKPTGGAIPLPPAGFVPGGGGGSSIPLPPAGSMPR